jgi:hypothetical protein
MSALPNGGVNPCALPSRGGLVLTTAHAAPTFGQLSGHATFITPLAMTSRMPKSAFEDQKGAIMASSKSTPPFP